MILKGIAASEGIFKGFIKIYSKEKKFSDTDILVSNSTTPKMSCEMLSAGAVVTEQGGLLSHTSIFCREIKKPCIVGIADLLSNVKDGMKAKVNGTKGTMELLSNG